MDPTDEEIDARTRAAWDSLDSLEFDLLVAAAESMDMGREMSKGELAIMTKFAVLCGLPIAQSLIDAMTDGGEAC